MKAFRVKGEFLMGGVYSPFNREIEAMDKDDAREKMFSLIGSEHRCKRNKIRVETIVEVPLDEVKDPLIRARIEEA
ncbi:MAG: 50S ribosomal protein L18a [Thermoplasmata archaeon]|nr:50S ribosomal protein L18a [Thermoplasmata archaeon]